MHEAIGLIIFGAHTNIMFVIKVKILLLNVHTGPPNYVDY